MQKRQKIWLWTWKLSWPQTIDTIKSALKLGYRTIDTARIYHNASELASAIRDSWKIWSTLRATPNQLFRWTFTPLAYTRRKRPQFLIISRSLSPKMNHQTNRSFKFPSPLLTKTLFSSPLSSFLQSNRTSSLPFWSSNARIRTVPSSRNYSLFSSWAWIFTQKPNNYQNCKKTSSKSCTNLPCPMFISVSFSNL